MRKKNIPYVKQFDKNGVCTNPITKENPYISSAPNRREFKKKKFRYVKNRLGSRRQVIKTSPFSYLSIRKYLQFIPTLEGMKKIEHAETLLATGKEG